MAVLVVCPKCGNKIKAAEHQIGKKAKCPQCKEVIALEPAAGGGEPQTIAFQSGATTTLPKPAALAAATAKAAGGSGKGTGSGKKTEKPEWKVMTGEQQEYGPVTKIDLDGWVADGRLDKECQLLKDGWEQWKWADEVYPELASEPSGAAAAVPAADGGFPGIATGPKSAPASSANPFAALGAAPKPPAGGGPVMTPAAGGPIVVPGAMPTPGPANPYSSPSAASGFTGKEMTGEVPTGVLNALRNTQVWVLVFVILSGLSFLASAGGGLLYMISLLAIVGARAVFMVIMVAPSVVMTGMFCWLLYGYYAAIGDVSRSPTAANLQKATEAQQRFWMVAGITAIVSIVLQILLAVVFMVLFAALMAAAAG